MASTAAASTSVTDTLLHYAVLSLLGPAWYCFGKLSQRAKLPLITGYVIGGIICGPSGLNLLRNEAQHNLQAIDHACLAIIALTAGAELHFDNIKRIHQQVIAITLWITVSTWLFVFCAMMLLVPYIPFLATINQQHVGSIVSLAAMLMVARSPASAIAVVKETGGKGPYCSLILAVVVMKDVLVFVCFAVNVEFTRMMQLTKDEGGMRLAQIVHPFVSLGASLLLGATAGVGISAFVNWRPSVWRPMVPIARRVPPAVTVRLKTLVVASLAICIFWLADRMDAEPLLACVMTGIVTANRRGIEQGKGPHEDVAEHTAHLTTIVNTTFFGLAGSSLRLGALMATIWVAVIVWAARLAAIYSGSWIGAWLGGTPADMRRRVWQGMVTQAGVAMGLAKTVSSRFPTWGPEFATLMVAIILLNLFVGPPLFRSAIFASGEARGSQSSDKVDPPSSPRRSDISTPRTSGLMGMEDATSQSQAEKGLSRSLNVSAAARSAPVKL